MGQERKRLNDDYSFGGYSSSKHFFSTTDTATATATTSSSNNNNINDDDDDDSEKNSNSIDNNNIQNISNNSNHVNDTIRLSRIISQHGINMQMSRKSAESVITSGQVTMAGKIVTNPSLKLDIYGADRDICRAIKVAGRHLKLGPSPNANNAHVNGTGTGTGTIDATSMNDGNTMTNQTSQSNYNNNTQSQLKTRVWIAHKLRGELVSEHDPLGRPSLIERLYHGGVGKPKYRKSKKGGGSNNHAINGGRVHLKPVGRLDMMTEGLILITNDGHYVREMTLPKNAIQRTYRVRVHGRITQPKLNSIRRGVTINGMYYKGMEVHLELNKGSTRSKGGGTNSWLRITCTEGKNRMIRKVMDHLGLQVTRLIRIGFGDYDLNTIPPGLAIEVPVKNLESQKRRGVLKKLNRDRKKKEKKEALIKEQQIHEESSPVQWIRH